MDKAIEYAPAIALILVAIGLIGYAIALVLAAFFPRALGARGAQLAAWFQTAPAQNLGLPCAAISAKRLRLPLSVAMGDVLEGLD